MIEALKQHMTPRHARELGDRIRLRSFAPLPKSWYVGPGPPSSKEHVLGGLVADFKAVYDGARQQSTQRFIVSMTCLCTTYARSLADWIGPEYTELGAFAFFSEIIGPASSIKMTRDLVTGYTRNAEFVVEAELRAPHMVPLSMNSMCMLAFADLPVLQKFQVVAAIDGRAITPEAVKAACASPFKDYKVPPRVPIEYQDLYLKDGRKVSERRSTDGFVDMTTLSTFAGTKSLVNLFLKSKDHQAFVESIGTDVVLRPVNAAGTVWCDPAVSAKIARWRGGPEMEEVAAIMDRFVGTRLVDSPPKPAKPPNPLDGPDRIAVVDIVGDGWRTQMRSSDRYCDLGVLCDSIGHRFVSHPKLHWFHEATIQAAKRLGVTASDLVHTHSALHGSSWGHLWVCEIILGTRKPDALPEFRHLVAACGPDSPVSEVYTKVRDGDGRIVTQHRASDGFLDTSLVCNASAVRNDFARFREGQRYQIAVDAVRKTGFEGDLSHKVKGLFAGVYSHPLIVAAMARKGEIPDLTGMVERAVASELVWAPVIEAQVVDEAGPSRPVVAIIESAADVQDDPGSVVDECDGLDESQDDENCDKAKNLEGDQGRLGDSRRLDETGLDGDDELRAGPSTGAQAAESDEIVVDELTVENVGRKIRKAFIDGKYMIALYDLIAAVLGSTKNATTTLFRLKGQHSEVIRLCSNVHQFPGPGQRPTPVVDSRGAQNIIMLLPGRLAAQYRTRCIEVISRFLAGDETLVDEIRHNAAVQATLPPEDPMAIFSQDLATRANTNAVVSRGLTNREVREASQIRMLCEDLLDVEDDDFDDELDLRSISIEETRPPTMNYIICDGKNADTGHIVFTWGKSTNGPQRTNTYASDNPRAKVIAVITCGMACSLPVEDTLRDFFRQHKVALVIKGRVSMESFALPPNQVIAKLSEVLEKVKRDHPDRVCTITFQGRTERIQPHQPWAVARTSQPLPDGTDALEVAQEVTIQERERTRQKELDSEQERERTRQKELDSEQERERTRQKELDSEQERECTRQKELDTQQERERTRQKELDTQQERERTRQKELDTQQEHERTRQKDRDSNVELLKMLATVNPEAFAQIVQRRCLEL